MNRFIISAVLLPTLAGSASACFLEVDPLYGVMWNCDNQFASLPGYGGGPFANTGAGAAAAEPPALEPCTGAGLAHGAQACPQDQRAIWDGGRTDALGIAAGAMGTAGAVTGNSVFGAIGAALGFGAAVSGAVDNGCCTGVNSGGPGPSGATTSDSSNGATAY